MEKKNPFEEANRYVENARSVLKEKGEYDPLLNRYNDRKYVRAAGHYLWHAVLIALDAVFLVRKDRRTRVNIDAYRDAIRKRDRKLLTLVNDGYETLHLSMGYDGIQRKATCDDGIRIALDIISICSGMA